MSRGNILEFIKKEPILTVATVLAIISCFFVTPGREYLSYINWRTLILLFFSFLRRGQLIDFLFEFSDVLQENMREKISDFFDFNNL